MRAGWPQIEAGAVRPALRRSLPGAVELPSASKLDIARVELTLIYAGELHQRNQKLEANNVVLMHYAKACRDEAEALRYRLRGVQSWYRKTSPHCFEVADIAVPQKPELLTV